MCVQSYTVFVIQILKYYWNEDGCVVKCFHYLFLLKTINGSEVKANMKLGFKIVNKVFPYVFSCCDSVILALISTATAHVGNTCTASGIHFYFYLFKQQEH